MTCAYCGGKVTVAGEGTGNGSTHWYECENCGPIDPEEATKRDEPSWIAKGNAFLEALPLKESWHREWKVDRLEWSEEAQMYAIIDKEGNVRGWAGERAIRAMAKLAEEVKDD